MYTNSYAPTYDELVFNLSLDYPQAKGVVVRKFKVAGTLRTLLQRYGGCLVCGNLHVGAKHHHFFRSNSRRLK